MAATLEIEFDAGPTRCHQPRTSTCSTHQYAGRFAGARWSWPSHSRARRPPRSRQPSPRRNRCSASRSALTSSWRPTTNRCATSSGSPQRATASSCSMSARQARAARGHWRSFRRPPTWPTSIACATSRKGWRTPLGSPMRRHARWPGRARRLWTSAAACTPPRLPARSTPSSSPTTCCRAPTTRRARCSTTPCCCSGRQSTPMARTSWSTGTGRTSARPTRCRR